MTGDEFTNYVVLVAREAGGSFDLLPNVIVARTAEEAIRRAVEGHDAGGTYVAVPARSWKPKRIRHEQKTIVRLDEVEEVATAEAEE